MEPTPAKLIQMLREEMAATPAVSPERRHERQSRTSVSIHSQAASGTSSREKLVNDPKERYRHLARRRLQYGVDQRDRDLRLSMDRDMEEGVVYQGRTSHYYDSCSKFT